MLLYLSKQENRDIFDYLAEEKGMVIKKYSGSFQLKSFILRDMRNLSHYQYMAIDVSCIKDSISEVVEAFTALKKMYKIRIILYVGNLLKDYEKLIQTCINIGIYNILITTEISKLKEDLCLVTSPLGMGKRELIKALNQEDQVLVVDNTIYEFVKKNIRIGVTGTMHRVGTTSLAINVAYFLAEKGARVCYVEANSHNHLQAITKEGVHFMDLYEEADEDFDVIVYDMGVVETKVVQAIKSKCDIGILCATGKAYEIQAYESCNPLFEGIDIHRIFSFVDASARGKLMQEYGSLYFSEYMPDPYQAPINRDLWLDIMKPWVKSSQ